MQTLVKVTGSLSGEGHEVRIGLHCVVEVGEEKEQLPKTTQRSLVSQAISPSLASP